MNSNYITLVDSVIKALGSEVQRLGEKYDLMVEPSGDGGLLVTPAEDFKKSKEEPIVTRLSHARFDARKRMQEILNVLSEMTQLKNAADVDTVPQVLEKLMLLQTHMGSKTDSKRVIGDIVTGINRVLQGGQKQVEAQAEKNPSLLDEHTKNAIIKLLLEDAGRLASTYEKQEQKKEKNEAKKVTPETETKYDISKKRIEAIKLFVRTLQRDDGTLSKQDVTSQLKELQGKMQTTSTKGLFRGSVTSVKTIDKAIKLVGENKGLLARLRGK